MAVRHANKPVGGIASVCVDWSITDIDNIHERVLLIEGDPATAQLIREVLADKAYGLFVIEWVATLAGGIERLNQGGIKVVLLNLFVSDSQGIASFDRIYLLVSHVPIVILCDADQEALAQQAVQQGAQDYILKDHIGGYSLSHALRNVIARKAAEEELFIERERADITLNSIGDAVISADNDGNVTYLNLVAERMLGWSRTEAAGRPLADVFHIIDSVTRKTVLSPIETAIRQNKPAGLCANSVLIRRDGSEIAIEDSAAPIHNRGGSVIGAVMVFHDVSEARAMVLKMAHLAQHDYLTDLPNRVLLNDRLTQAIALARRRRKQLAVLFMDLDLFKNINDSLGHLMGDKLLQSVADRLLKCIRGSDTVSRLGGNEFVVLLGEIDHIDDAVHCAKNIISALTSLHTIEKHELSLTMSIGISIYPDDGENAETLIKNADAAMYHAKQNGRNNYQFFKQQMNDRIVERQSLEAGLRAALIRQEFVLYYQPIINLETGAISGTEALIRWRHPQRGLLLPEQFVPVAEECGLIVPIGRWVLREACRQTRVWLDAGLHPCPLSINISAVEFRSNEFLDGVRESLQETQLAPGNLEVELTESVLMQDLKSTTTVLKTLKTMGVQLAIDDFGTGYSSLSYLKRFPIDNLKIDKSFVCDIASDPDNTTIVSAVIGMGNSLNKRVSAEGVETQAQLDFLRAQHCSGGQGFFFSPPVTAGAYAQLLINGIRDPNQNYDSRVYFRRF